MTPDITDDYGWQRIAYSQWVSIGCRGIIKAVPGAGKTIAGVRVIERYIDEHPGASVMICAPTDAIKDQWTKNLSGVGLCTLNIVTYFTGVHMLQAGLHVDLLVADECHASQTPVQGQILKFGVKHVLGLSATPEDSAELIGPVFIDVSWSEANVAPFKIIYVLFPMTSTELPEYQRLTQQVKAVLQAEEEGTKVPQKMPIIMRRRSYVYMLKRRVDIAVDLILTNPDERIMVFSERVDQVKQIALKLKELNIPFAERVGTKDSLGLYTSGQVSVCLSVKMLKEGFDDPTTTMGIIVSSALTERNQVQTMGRMVRFRPGKTAKVYWLLAERTSDVELIRRGLPGEVIRLDNDWLNNSTGVANNNSPAPEPRVDQPNVAFGQKCLIRLSGWAFSVDYKGSIFFHLPNGRKYVDIPDAELNLAQRWVAEKKGGGVMYLTPKGELLTKLGFETIYLGTLNPVTVERLEKLRHEAKATTDAEEAALVKTSKMIDEMSGVSDGRTNEGK